MSVSVLALGAALDTYFGGGGLEWLADLCMGRSDAEINTASMTGLPPAAAVPMLGVGLGTAALALFVDSGKAPEDGPFGPPPSADERLRLLLAMSSVAATTELPSLSEFSRIYRFVCGGNPYPGEVSTAYDRCASGEVIGDSFVSLTEVRSETERQRILAAVVLLGCSDGGCGPAALASINRIVLDIGTTDEDVGEVTRILTMDKSAPVPMVDLRLDVNRRREGFWA